MFKIEVFVDDKRLPELLRAMAGLVRGLPSVVPVVNAEEDHPSGLKAMTNGALLNMFTEHLARLNDPFGPEEVRSFLKSVGKSQNSYSYLLGRAMAARLVRKTGKPGHIRYHPIKRLTHHKEG